ncbi:hypothetical protein [Lentzea flaviverrucosa]|nr:hypothetical protein [Lentzea flaviverrucosa]
MTVEAEDAHVRVLDEHRGVAAPRSPVTSHCWSPYVQVAVRSCRVWA